MTRLLCPDTVIVTNRLCIINIYGVHILFMIEKITIFQAPDRTINVSSQADIGYGCVRGRPVGFPGIAISRSTFEVLKA